MYLTVEPWVCPPILFFTLTVVFKCYLGSVRFGCFYLCSFCYVPLRERYKIHISWHGGCWTAGCLLVHKLAGTKHLWGPLIIIPWQQFCHMHGRPGASRAIRDSEFRKTGPEKGALRRAEYRAVKRDVRKQVDPVMVDAGKTRGVEPFHPHLLQ